MLRFPIKIRPRSWTATVVVGAYLALAAGCATYSSTAMKVRAEASGGNLVGARAILEKEAGDDEDVLSLLQRGLLLFYEGQYAQSNLLLQHADRRIEELYTKSLTAETLAFLSNDATLPYTGYPHERVLLHIYGALNYLALGDEDGALVEFRRVGERLAQMEEVRGDKKGYSRDALAEWLSAVLFANDGDGNAALVAARRAQAAFEEYQALWGVRPPARLTEDHILWARRFGFPEEAEELVAAYGKEPDPPARDEGEILLVYESGFVSHLEEVDVSFPILTDDRDDRDDFARTVYLRGHRGALVLSDADRVKIDYWVRVAFPTMVDTAPQLRRARLLVDGRTTEAQLVEDVSALARLTFEEGSTNRAVRTIARGIAKYAAVNAVEEKDRPMRWLANAIVGLSERADTRSWSMLPDRIHLARLRLPAGTYPVVVEVLDARGGVAQTASFDAIRVRPGQITVVHHRSFQ